MRFRLLILLIVSCLTGFYGFGQTGVVIGTIKSENNYPLPAEVILRRGSDTIIKVKTNPQGGFITNNVPVGKGYSICIKAVGFKTTIWTDLVVTDTTWLNYKLEVGNETSAKVFYIPTKEEKIPQDKISLITVSVTNKNGKLLKSNVSAIKNDQTYIKAAQSAGKYILQINDTGTYRVKIVTKYRGKRRADYFYSDFVIEQVPVNQLGFNKNIDIQLPLREWSQEVGPSY